MHCKLENSYYSTSVVNSKYYYIKIRQLLFKAHHSSSGPAHQKFCYQKSPVFVPNQNIHFYSVITFVVGLTRLVLLADTPDGNRHHQPYNDICRINENDAAVTCLVWAPGGRARLWRRHPLPIVKTNYVRKADPENFLNKFFYAFSFIIRGPTTHSRGEDEVVRQHGRWLQKVLSQNDIVALSLCCHRTGEWDLVLKYAKRY